MGSEEEGPRDVVVVVDGDVELVVGRADGLRSDLALVDTLARLQLAARRVGSSIRLRNPSEELLELLELVGLDDLVVGRAGSALEPGREAGDPPA